MKKTAVVSAIMALSLATAGIAFGQDRGDRNDHGRNEQNQGGDRQDRNDHNRRDDRQDRNDHNRRGEQQDRRGHEGRRGDDREARRDERGAGPNHDFRRGERLPPEYRNRQYVVDNWREHHLSPPPRGYHWVQTGGDYVLVSVGSGVIFQIFLGN